MNVPSRDITDFLEGQGLSLTAATNLFEGNEPPQPDKCVTIYDTPDAGPQTFLSEEDGDGDADRYEYVGIQVRVRANGYNEAFTLAQQIDRKMHNKGNYVINSTLYSIIAVDNPSLLEYDEKNRAIVITNYQVQRTPNS